MTRLEIIQKYLELDRLCQSAQNDAQTDEEMAAAFVPLRDFVVEHYSQLQPFLKFRGTLDRLEE